MRLEKKETTMDLVNRGLARRYRRERWFRLFGLGAILTSICFLGLLFFSIIGNGWSAFQQTEIMLDIHFDKARFDVDNLARADYGALVKDSLRDLFPEVQGRRDKRKLYRLASSGAAFMLQDMVMKDSGLIGTSQKIWLPADDEVDMLLKGYIPRDVPEDDRRLKDNQIEWVDRLIAAGRNLQVFVAPSSALFLPLPLPWRLLFPLGWPRLSILKSLLPAIDGLILLRSTSITWQPFHP